MLAVKITVPNKVYEDKVHGIQFNKGVAIVEDEAHGQRVAKRFGYKVEKIKQPAKSKDAKSDKKVTPDKEKAVKADK